MANAAERQWVLRSWDRFRVPRPFSRARVIYGAPIPIPADLDEESFEAHRQEVDDRLNQLTDDAARPFGDRGNGK